jgi:hypothetical protein
MEFFLYGMSGDSTSNSVKLHQRIHSATQSRLCRRNVNFRATVKDSLIYDFSSCNASTANN